MLKKLLIVAFGCFVVKASAAPGVELGLNGGRQQYDTLRLTLPAAERIFLDSNLELLAAYYDVESGRALEEQARKWDNPLLVTDQNIYANNKFFSHQRGADGTIDGQVFVQVQQLIKTAGKRRKQLDLARAGTNIRLWQFRELMRTLKFQLVTSYQTLAKLQEEGRLLNQNLVRLNQLSLVMQSQYQQGNIALKEYLRIQSLVVAQNNAIVENTSAQWDAVNDLRTLLRLNGGIFLTTETLPESATGNTDLNLAALIDTAIQHNPDYNLQLAQLTYSKQQVALQKSLAVPDVTAGLEYDQNSNYTPQYYGLTLNVPIPILDRNKGNIKSANWEMKAESLRATQVFEKMQNDILAAYAKYRAVRALATPVNDSFYNRYEQLFQNIAESYNKRQISLIEFLTFFSDYQDVKA
ncbi:MAG: TolC family protein, partial [Chitinophagia bacterium]|nr:TolC family protein [Chitinophagia bacterium]